MPACRPLEEACEEMFSKHFDYCTTASAEFKMLERASFMKILKASVNTARVTCLPLTVWNVERWINVVNILSCDYYDFCSTPIW